MNKKSTNIASFISNRNFIKSIPYFKCQYCKSIHKISNLSYYQLKHNTCSQLCYNFVNYKEYQRKLDNLVFHNDL